MPITRQEESKLLELITLRDIKQQAMTRTKAGMRYSEVDHALNELHKATRNLFKYIAKLAKEPKSCDH